MMSRLLLTVFCCLLFPLAFPAAAAPAAQADSCAAAVRVENLQRQPVTLVLLNGAQLEPADLPADVQAAQPVAGTAAGGINVRSGPGTEFAIIGGLAAGQEITVVGRNAAGDWLQIEYDGAIAWVFAELIATDSDTNRLPVIESEADAALNLPVQAFQLLPGACDAAALLLQTPRGSSVRVFINGVDLRVRDTVLLALADAALRVSSLESALTLVVADQALSIAPGETLTLLPDAAPTRYTLDDLAGLPFDLLPERPQLAPPAGTLYAVAPDGSCGFVSADGSAANLTTAPAGLPLVVNSAVRGNPQTLAFFLERVERTLTLDSEPVTLWSLRGPFETDDGGVFYTWWWVIPQLAPGTYTLALTTTNSDSNLDGTVTCTLVVA